MGLPDVTYIPIPRLAVRWDTDRQRVEHYIVEGKLTCCTWVEHMLTYLGYYSYDAKRARHFNPDRTEYVEGLIGVRPQDCRRIFKRPRGIKVREFVSIKTPDMRIQVSPEDKAHIVIGYEDLVVRSKDINDFEMRHRIMPQEAVMYGMAEPLAPDYEVPPGKPLIQSKHGFAHSEDYEHCVFADIEFRFGNIQANAVRVLDEQFKTDNPWLHGKRVLDRAGSEGKQMKSLFKSQPHWRKLIRSDGKGHYALNLAHEIELVE